MPRYLFHLSFGERTIRDDEGVELPSRSAASGGPWWARAPASSSALTGMR
jgi:hypothetical protein